MSTFAIVDATGVCVSVMPSSDGEPTRLLEAIGAQAVEIDGLDPLPDVGWTLGSDGTWTKPVVDQATDATHTFMAQIPAQLAQAQADAATIATWLATQTVLPADVAAAMARGGPAGWVLLLEGMQALTTAVVQPPPS